MTVADVFDAVISRRVYKPAMDFDKAKAIIEEGRGTRFDPDVVDAFLRCFDAFCAIARRVTDSDTPLPAGLRASTCRAAHAS